MVLHLKSAQCLNRNRLEKIGTFACMHKLMCMNLESLLKWLAEESLTLLMEETVLGNVH